MLAIDHLVIAAKDPEQTAYDFQKKHNVKVIQGGKHENWGTHNYLAYLANDCYFEWIGVFDEDRARKSTNPLIKQLVHTLKEGQEGLFQVAFRTMNMNQLINHFQTEDISYTGPIPGSREKPDGTTLVWKMLFPHPNENNELYPFLIEWNGGINKPDHERDISDVSLSSITVSHKMMNKWTDIYQLRNKDHKIQLTNGEIHFSQTEHLQFTFAAK